MEAIPVHTTLPVKRPETLRSGEVSIRWRLAVASRVAAALFGGYLLAALSRRLSCAVPADGEGRSGGLGHDALVSGVPASRALVLRLPHGVACVVRLDAAQCDPCGAVRQCAVVVVKEGFRQAMAWLHTWAGLKGEALTSSRAFTVQGVAPDSTAPEAG